MATSTSAVAHGDEHDGVVFPQTADGRRSSTDTGRAILADALRVVNADAAAACERERNWRKRYIVHARRLVEEAARATPAALAIAHEGLRSTHQRLQFARDGAVGTIDEALRNPRRRFITRTVAGISKAGPTPVTIPYQGQSLTGDALRRQLDRWEADGIVEPSFAQAIWRVQAHPEWLDLSDQRFALLGAQAEMAPLPWLLRWRATVFAVDLPQAGIWQRMIRLAHAGNGALCMPCATDPGAQADYATLARHTGADLICDTPEIAAWLESVDGPLTVGAYAYLDGAQHVRVATAMDAIQSAFASRRGDVTLAMLATPTDAFAVPAAALNMAHQRFSSRGWAARAAGVATLGRAFARNGAAIAQADQSIADVVAGIVDTLVVEQGPNYMLAKRLQQWRALAARTSGTRVSIHVAPPSLTGSVLKNKLIAAAYRAAHRFGAQAFEPATAAALMAALLVHDLRHPEASANPDVSLVHPLQLLNDAACHGGLWRMPYAARSALPAAAAIGMIVR